MKIESKVYVVAGKLCYAKYVSDPSAVHLQYEEIFRLRFRGLPWVHANRSPCRIACSDDGEMMVPPLEVCRWRDAYDTFLSSCLACFNRCQLMRFL